MKFIKEKIQNWKQSRSFNASNCIKKQGGKDWKEIQGWYSQHFTSEKNKEEEGLTEFEKRFIDIIRLWMSGNTNPDENLIQLRFDVKELLNLARRELEKDIEHSAVEFAKFYMEDVNPSFEKVQESEELWKWKMSCLRGVNKAYTQGKKDSLKNLPKWKKAEENLEFSCNVVKMDEGGTIFPFDVVWKDEYYIKPELLKSLPKED